MLHLLLYLLLPASLSATGLPVSSNCSCQGKPSVKEAVKTAALVAVGTVVRQEVVPLVDSITAKHVPSEEQLLSEHRDVRKYLVLHKYVLAVERLYKGNVTSDTVAVYSGTPATDDCAIRPTVGEKYLVYGTAETYYAKTGQFRFPEGRHIFWVNRCSRTGLFMAAEEAGLKQHVKPKQRKQK